jgi:predicted nuclease of predicted toxin-antitoxin system
VKFNTDGNLPLEASAVLRERGFDAETVWDEDLSGADDCVIAARVMSEGRILLTLDLDFANIQAYPPDRYAGIIVLRLEKHNCRRESGCDLFAQSTAHQSGSDSEVPLKRNAGVATKRRDNGIMKSGPARGRRPCSSRLMRGVRIAAKRTPGARLGNLCIQDGPIECVQAARHLGSWR